jgi:uncharacterized protein YkwD
MRKPLVVVCVGASAVLLAGAIAATTAGADTTPDGPRAAVAALPTGAAEPPAGPDVPPIPSAGTVGPFREPPAGATPQRPGGQGGPAADPVRPRPDVDEPAGDRPAHGTPARDEPGEDDADRSKPVRADPPAEPAPAEPAPAEPAPDGQKPVRQAAQQDVSPGTGAGSVSSPVQRQVLALVNDSRRQGGCDDLTLDRRLIEAANAHAADMARRGYFAHRSPGGADAGDRVQDAGYRWSRYGENIARGQDSAHEVVDGWLHSPEHRANIMDCDLHQMGVGLAFADDRTPYWVQDFATPQ